LLEGFNNVADTSGSSTPGHLNFAPYGVAFVDPFEEPPQRVLKAIPRSALLGEIPPVPNDVSEVINKVIEKESANVVRSTADHAAYQMTVHAALRDFYHQMDNQIAEQAKEMLRQGKPAQEVAKWRVDSTNALKDTIRKKGNQLLDVIASGKRGAWDKPTYEMLKAGDPRLGKLPKTDAQIINRVPNKGVDKIARALKVGGRVLLVLDVATGVFVVVTAPPGERLATAVKETSRIGGALAGGYVGMGGGAYVGGAIGSLFGPGPGTAIGAGIGAFVCGFGGAILGGWGASTGAARLVD